MSGPRDILVADDDENDRRLTLAALDELGAELEVRTVRDGAELLDYLRREGDFKDRSPGNPALLLLDLNMPRVDGWEVLRTIKSDPALKAIPVVVFTSSSRDRDVERCYQLGANAYVVKPIDFGEFTVTVRNIRVFWTAHNHTPQPAFSPAAMRGPGQS
ncbi:MAG: response regulator [Opitutae bacterium]|nr:response regulator [Opitutae bacterium]